MTNDYLAVFLYRWDDANDVRDASTVGFGEQRQIQQHYPSVVIGVAARPVGEPIEHHSSTPEYADRTEREFREHVHERAADVRWFDPLDCSGDE